LLDLDYRYFDFDDSFLPSSASDCDCGEPPLFGWCRKVVKVAVAASVVNAEAHPNDDLSTTRRMGVDVIHRLNAIE
jgi:hypothetical protein